MLLVRRMWGCYVAKRAVSGLAALEHGQNSVMLKLGPFEKTRAQVAVAQIRALVNEDTGGLTVRIAVDETGLSANDRLLWRASKGDAPMGLTEDSVEDALSFLSWFQLGETLKIFQVEVDGADAELEARIVAEVGPTS